MSDTLLIFDCDGVLVDSELISLGLIIDHCEKFDLSLDMKQACDCFLGKPVAVAGAEASRMFETKIPDVDLEDFQNEIISTFRKSLEPVEGIADALSALPMAKCVASSSNFERINISLELTGLKQFFDGNLFSTDMVARGKPHPDVFLHAAEEMGFNASSAIVIEDSPAGLRAAKSAHMKTIAFVGGTHAPHADLKSKLEALSPDILIENMSQLEEAVMHLSR